MVVLTGGVIAAPSSNGLISTGAATGAVSGIISGVLNTAITKSSLGTAVSGATAVGGAASAMLGSTAAVKMGAVASGVASGAVISSISGMVTAAGTSSIVCGVSSLVSEIISGPLGWVIIGINEEEPSGRYTFDCWKQILHDQSSEPSTGKRLRDIVMDPRIKKVTTIDNTHDIHLPHLLLENVWDEQFRIDYVRLSSDQLAAHAVKI